MVQLLRAHCRKIAMSESTPPPMLPTSCLITTGNFFFRYRDAAFPVFFIFLLFLFRPQFPEGELNYRMEWIALAVAGIGQLLRSVTVALQYIIRGGLHKQVYADKLVTGGMFAHCRNPLYVGNVLLVLSILIIANNFWAYTLGGVFILFVYVSIVAAEEQFLWNKFGDEFEDYCQQVNRWVPDFRGFRETLKSMEFNWRRLLVKEYSSVYFWSLSVVALVTYKTLLYYSPIEAQVPLLVLSIILMLSTGSFFLIRFLKKTGRLTEKAFHLRVPLSEI